MACQSPSIHNQTSSTNGRKACSIRRRSKLGTPLVVSCLYINCCCINKDVTLMSESSQEFKDIIRTIRTGAFTPASKNISKHVKFAIKKGISNCSRAKYNYYINNTMKLEIEFSGNNRVLIQKSAGQCLLHSSSLKLQQQLYLEIVSSKVQEDTQLK